MDEKGEKMWGVALILFGIPMWEILPPMGLSFTAVLLIHMSLVIPGVYLFERRFIKYITFKVRGER